MIVDRAGKRIIVDPSSPLALLLGEAQAVGEAVIVDAGIVAYALRVDSQPSAPNDAETTYRPPDPVAVERSRQGIRDAAGSWRDVDDEAFKAYVAERRRASSRPPVRL